MNRDLLPQCLVREPTSIIRTAADHGGLQLVAQAAFSKNPVPVIPTSGIDVSDPVHRSPNGSELPVSTSVSF